MSEACEDNYNTAWSKEEVDQLIEILQLPTMSKEDGSRWVGTVPEFMVYDKEGKVRSLRWLKASCYHIISEIEQGGWDIA